MQKKAKELNIELTIFGRNTDESDDIDIGD